MIGAIEKQKFVYVLNRMSCSISFFSWFICSFFALGRPGDAATNLTISSPLEAHKSHTLCFSLCGVDVGFENPTFAALEVDYEDADAPAADDV